DYGTELKSWVGTLDFENFEAVIALDFHPDNSNVMLSHARLDYESVKGSGLLKNQEVIRRALDLAETTLRKQIRKLLESDEVQSSVQQALLLWARLQSANDWESILPGTIRVESGLLAYSVE